MQPAVPSGLLVRCVPRNPGRFGLIGLIRLARVLHDSTFASCRSMELKRLSAAHTPSLRRALYAIPSNHQYRTGYRLAPAALWGTYHGGSTRDGDAHVQELPRQLNENSVRSLRARVYFLFTFY